MWEMKKKTLFEKRAKKLIKSSHPQWVQTKLIRDTAYDSYVPKHYKILKTGHILAMTIKFRSCVTYHIRSKTGTYDRTSGKETIHCNMLRSKKETLYVSTRKQQPIMHHAMRRDCGANHRAYWNGRTKQFSNVREVFAEAVYTNAFTGMWKHVEWAAQLVVVVV